MTKEPQQDHEHTAIPYRPEHVAMAKELADETRRNGGMAPVDIEQFWADDALASKDPFNKDIPQPAFMGRLNHECVFAELGLEIDLYRYFHNEKFQLELNRAYNKKSREIVGKAWLREEPIPEADKVPGPKGLHDIFEAENVWHDQSWWLQQSATNEDELKALLDRIDEKDIRKEILPDGWDKTLERAKEKGVDPPLYRSQRGPVTFACSIYGPENLLMLLMTNPELGERLRDTILRVMQDIRRILNEEAGYDRLSAPRGFSFADDNCCLLTPELYEFFGAPILQGMFDYCAPDPEDWRFQHSDSDMAHLLPILSRFHLQRVNFGPTLTCKEIREAMPNTVISGQLAPFTYMRNEHENIVLEFLRDHEMTKATRGLHWATAGSVSNGTKLTSMRLAMAAIQRYGRYE
ncbi:MAG: hypothetical protein ACOC2L_01590 [Candidatus Sumerlaeota bacterium]